MIGCLFGHVRAILSLPLFVTTVVLTNVKMCHPDPSSDVLLHCNIRPLGSMHALNTGLNTQLFARAEN